jgi:hypothetical protein
LSPYWWFYGPSHEFENGIDTGYTHGSVILVRP